MVHSFSLFGHAPLFSHNAITHMNIQHDSQSASLIYPCEKASLHVHSGGAGVVRSDARAPGLALPGARSAISNIAENAISKTFSFMERAVI